MFSKLLRSFVAVLAMSSIVGCAAQPPALLPEGVIGGTGHDRVIPIEGRAGTDVMSALQFPVPTMCAGRVIQLRAEYRTEHIRGGTQSYHGIHFDYELRANNQTTWAPDWQADPSPHWTTVTRTWAMPANMRFAAVRVGLQGVNGTMYVRNLVINC